MKKYQNIYLHLSGIVDDLPPGKILLSVREPMVPDYPSAELIINDNPANIFTASRSHISGHVCWNMKRTVLIGSQRDMPENSYSTQLTMRQL